MAPALPKRRLNESPPREDQPITNVADAMSQPGKPVDLGSRIAVGGTFSIVATGTLPDSEIRRRIKGVVRSTPYGKEKITILYWADNYPIAENLVALGKRVSGDATWMRYAGGGASST